MALTHKHLKRALYKTPDTGDTTFERYVIRTPADLKAFSDAIGGLTPLMYNPMLESVREGRIVIANDVHPSSGHPTWCFECTDPTDTHSSTFHRFKELN